MTSQDCHILLRLKPVKLLEHPCVDEGVDGGQRVRRRHPELFDHERSINRLAYEQIGEPRARTARSRRAPASAPIGEMASGPARGPVAAVAQAAADSVGRAAGRLSSSTAAWAFAPKSFGSESRTTFFHADPTWRGSEPVM
jgi:hypothetical protein